jgi:hypothetical protein
LKISLNIRLLAKLALVSWFIIAIYFQHNQGLADNGDFTRSMRLISSGPIGIEPNWPAAGSQDWSKRFFNYWIPYWKLDFDISKPTTSAVILWLPGALLNRVFYSSNILYLPNLSLFPKLIIFGVLLLLFKWVEFQTRYRTALLFSIGVPVIFLITTTDYVAYLNSFYEESASFVYLFLLLASILAMKQRPSLPYLLCSLASILLLATSKTANLYWPVLALPIVFYVWYIKNQIRLRTVLPICFAIILTLASTFAFIARVGATRENPYHSLFYGALTFSEDPSMHLRQLRMSGAIHCVGVSAYSPIGEDCISKYSDQLSFQNTIRVIHKEPAVMFRMLKHVLDNMQDVSLDYLGKYSSDDPRSQTLPSISSKAVEERFFLTTDTPLLNLWAILKFRFFPTGYALAFVLIVLVVGFAVGVKHNGVYQDLSIVGSLVTFGCIANMIVAILGDGKYELIKHLFLSNVLFDIAAIIFVNLVFVFSLEVLTKSLGWTSQK